MIVDIPDLTMFFFYRAWDKMSKPVIIRLVETSPTMRLFRIIPHEPNVVVSRI